MIPQIKKHTPRFIRLAVHSFRNFEESITDSFRMWHQYERYTRRFRMDELDYALPDHLNLALEGIADFQKTKNDIFDTPPNVTFISNYLPRFDQISSEFRIFNILKILLENRCKIDYLYYGKNWNDAKYKKALHGDISFRHIPRNHRDWMAVIAKNNPDYVWITNLWSIPYFEFTTPLVKQFKEENFSFTIVVDTMDFHYKEFFRKHEMTGNPDDLELANEFLKNETLLYRLADKIVVVSEQEKRYIQEKISGIKDFKMIPNIHDIHGSTRSYEQRGNMCFVGSFTTKHNVDAVRYFVEDIFPHILKKNPSAEFHIIGYGSENYRKEFASPNVKVIGSLKRLQEALTYYKLFVCPMTYGAGVKGKIGSAIEAGVPVVTTSVGAEGFPLKNGEEFFIADSPLEFADRCHQCINDRDLWYQFSIKSQLAFAQKFSPRVVAEKLGQVLTN